MEPGEYIAVTGRRRRRHRGKAAGWAIQWGQMLGAEITVDPPQHEDLACAIADRIGQGLGGGWNSSAPPPYPSP